ncbi:transport protein TonB [mine drainage metagenome]|uniref:Transport protein TonB n=1 Tax=mine drainage metagenome TaxID=410659 RepID=A0A1J5SEK1_9ZZZZ
MTTSRLNWALLLSVVLHTALLASFAVGEGGGGGMTAQARRLTVRLQQPNRFALPLSAESRQAATQSVTGGQGSDSSHGLPAPLTPIAPEYPEAALALGIPGRVEILAHVGEDGRVESAVVVKTSLDGVFDRSALEAVRETRFAPGTVNGKPTKGIYRAVVLYRPR